MEQTDLVTEAEAHALRAAAAILRTIVKRTNEYDRLRALDVFDAARIGHVRAVCEQADDSLFTAMNCAATYGANANADAVASAWNK